MHISCKAICRVSRVRIDLAIRFLVWQAWIVFMTLYLCCCYDLFSWFPNDVSFVSTVVSLLHELPCNAPICNAYVLLKNMIGKHEIPIRKCTLIITVLIRKNIYDWVPYVDWICFRFIFTEVFSFHSKLFFWYQISLCNILNIRTFWFRYVENPELVDVVDNILVWLESMSVSFPFSFICCLL